MEENTYFSYVLRKERQNLSLLPRELLGKNIKSQNLIRSEMGNEITGRTELYHRLAAGSLFIKGALMK